jgi:hypothetical protein
VRAVRGAIGAEPSAVRGADAVGTPGKQTLVEGLDPGAVQSAPGPDGAGTREVMVTASSLRVRSAPDTSSKQNILGKLHEGDRVPTSGRAGDWLIVAFGAGQGYIAGKYTKPVTVLDDIDDWLRSFTGGDHDNDHDPAGPGPSPDPSLDPSQPAGPHGPDAPSGPPGPTPTPGDTPSGAAELTDPALAAYLAALGNRCADAAAHAVASCEHQSARLAENLDAHEERGAERDALVASIADARAQIALLDGEGLDAGVVAYVRPLLYGLLLRCAPYYSQGRNIDVLETATDTRTCNLTSLAMVLEGLGKSANNYAGPRDKVLAVARFTPYAPRIAGAKGKVSGATGDWGKLAALRLPDFLELAAVAECLGGGTSDAEVLAAAQSAWARIVNEFAIHINLARQFGVAGETRTLEGGLGDALGSIKKSARKEMQEVVDARNKAERTGDSGAQASYERLRDASSDALEGTKIEAGIPLREYRETVLAHVGAELASGAGVFMLMAAHYARVQAVSEDHVIVDDPGRDFRSGQKVLWPEARAMGYFKKRIVFTG